MSLSMRDKLAPPNRNDRETHSRTTSTTTNGTESPPVTPRSLTFVNPVNPFATPDHVDSYYPFPTDTVSTSVSASFTDLPPGPTTSRPGSRSTHASGLPTTTSVSARPSSVRSREAFASPRTRPMTIYSTVQPSISKPHRERPKSTMLTSTSVLQKPWITSRDPYRKMSYFITYGFMFLGIAAGVVRGYFSWISVPVLSGNLCMVLDENFDSEDGLFGDNGTFFREVDMSGFGNGQFEMTTDSSNNSYVQNGYLYITPTLTSDIIGENAIIDGSVFNITNCTFNITQGLTYTSSAIGGSAAIAPDEPFDLAGYTKACSAVSNATTGQVINPVRSARLTTRKSASIKYGRVEVRAKIPTGDWLWPAIWMLPVNDVYGAWPLSGEIDIMEARGNGPSYPNQGSNYVRGSLNWGPLSWLNAVYKTFGWWSLRRGSYDQDFHSYVLEWDPKFIRISVDSRLHHMLDLSMNIPFFQRGDFPAVVQNGSEAIALANPWINGTVAAPFDQPFYLILDVAVGGTNGWFPDGSGKPWLDGSTTPMLDFWRMKNEWLGTWPDNEGRSMVVDYVKMWQQC